MKNDVRFLQKGERLDTVAATGISLHCHTLHSKELLDFVPYYAERIPVARVLWRREMRRYLKTYGETPDFKSGYWEPPLTAAEVRNSETQAIETLGLEAIVSITDHDSINAGLEFDNALAPISMEWTVPFENAFFHIGVHNLPPGKSETIAADLLAYTRAKGEPDRQRLAEILCMLNETPGVLVVLNHPVWDIEMIGQQAHEQALDRFLLRYRQWIDALEINGFRSWSENETVMELAKAVGLPLVSGGDRHCCQANTMINMTDAASFAEFVDEVKDGHSRIAVTPEYHIPLPVRQIRSMAQILGNYKAFPTERQTWSDRVFLDYNDGSGLKTITDHLDGRRPMWMRFTFFALAVLAHPVAAPFISWAVGDEDIGRDDSIKTEIPLHAGTEFPTTA